MSTPAVIPCPDCQGQWMYINRIANPARTCDGGPQEDGIDHEGARVIELTVQEIVGSPTAKVSDLHHAVLYTAIEWGEPA